MENDTSSSLDHAKQAMANWRSSRTKRRPIPDRVWDTVLPLIKQYSYSTISKELGLSYQQIKNKLASRQDPPLSEQKAFISVGLSPKLFKVDQQISGCKITLTKPNGLSLVIDGASGHLINVIIASFVGLRYWFSFILQAQIDFFNGLR